MASTWASQKCLTHGDSCQLLDLHRSSAIAVALFVSLFVVTSLLAGGWSRKQWPLLISVFLLVVIQICLGSFSVQFGLGQPLLTVGHQLVAALLVAFLSALSFKRPQASFPTLSSIDKEPLLEICHG